MNYYIKTVYPPVVIAVGVGLALGLTYQLLEPKLLEAIKNEELAAVKKAIVSASGLEEVDSVGDNGATNRYYVAKDNAGGKVGYIFKAEAYGYGGPVQCIVGFTNGAIDSVVVAAMAKETPGLGTKIAESEWIGQFKGLTIGQIPKNKADFAAKGLDAVTGATYSSMAVAKSLNQAFAQYKKLSPDDFIVITTNIKTNFYMNYTTNVVTNQKYWETDSTSGATVSAAGATNAPMPN